MGKYFVACDAGGTMTDVIIVDEEGRSVIGKAPTSPHDESIGYMESLEEALEYLGIDPKKEGRTFGRDIETAIYTGTSMLNTVINMSGLKTGLLVTRGFEDIIAQGRGSQTFIGAQWSEITHMQYRKHRTPLVPRSQARGVTERIDMFGAPVIPMYEHEVEQGVRELLVDEECEALAVVFLHSYTNPHARGAGRPDRQAGHGTRWVARFPSSCPARWPPPPVRCPGPMPRSSRPTPPAPPGASCCASKRS